ncbi:TetR/AcrR family transcriptional regulator [Pseudoclavibacter sp. AY1F1]|uniref:TetR/AcrR family transcriptional regulator n=1 Tax=Pseudoclavibacter sp. AY1F1 TaxID=2080583 RepID=UPI001C67B052|nr:TetR/AcrR family transcriptional regulator [Pseudoclavibacter sp. AY1F1]
MRATSRSAPGEGRASIVEAGYELISELGYASATTARICARAGISSGTFFHYFPTKIDLLVGILEADATDSKLQAEALNSLAAESAEAGLQAWLEALLEEAGDPHLAGFVAALGAAGRDPRLAELLADAASLQEKKLEAIISAGQQQGLWRSDLAPGRLAVWVGVIADGLLSRTVEDPNFAAVQGADELRDLIDRYLAH